MIRFHRAVSGQPAICSVSGRAPSPDESAGACQVPDQLLSQRWPASGKSGVTSGSAVALRYSTPSVVRS